MNIITNIIIITIIIIIIIITIIIATVTKLRRVWVHINILSNSLYISSICHIRNDLASQ